MRQGPAASVARRLCRARRDDRLDLDLDQELGADEARDPDHRRDRADVCEELAVRPADVELVPLAVDDVHAGVHDVAHPYGPVIADPGLELGVARMVAALGHAFASTRAASAAFTSGQSSSITLYQAESRRSPPRTSMCLRKMPSNSAGSAARAARARSFVASVL